MFKNIILCGYGGHGLVATDILLKAGNLVAGYCDCEEKKINIFNLEYKGKENVFFANPLNCDIYSAFVAVGKVELRIRIFEYLQSKNISIINAIHPNSTIAKSSDLGEGVFVAANAVINPACSIGNGVICNTSSSIDHECTIGQFSHLGPGAVLCGNVTVGKNSFIGANSTVIPGKTIGDNVIVGAGSTVITNLVKPGVYAGSPARLLKLSN